MSPHTRRGRRALFILIVLLASLGAFSATSYVVWRLRVENIDRQLEAAALSARSFEDHLTQSFSAIERSLVHAAEGDQRAASLTHFLRHAPYLRSIAVLGRDGRIVVSTDRRNLGVHLPRSDFLPEASGPLEDLRAGPFRNGRDFHDTGSPQAGSGYIPVSIDVRQGDAHWNTVVASVNPDYFLNFYGNHIAPEDGTVELLRYDGHLLLSTDEQAIPGGPDDNGGLIARLADAEAGRLQETLPDGRTVLTAYRASRAYPFVLVVRMDRDRLLAGWRLEAIHTVSIVAAAFLSTLALAILYFVRFERLARDQERDQARQRIAAIAFESQEGMVVTDNQARILQVNKAFTRITGYSAEEAIGVSMNILRSGVHDADFYRGIRTSLTEVGTWAGEIINRHKDGTLHPHFLTITAVRNDAGEVTHFVSAQTDITERKRAEIDLRIAAAAFQSREGMCVTDATGVILRVNRAFTKVTGYSAEEAVGQTPRILRSGRHDKAFYEGMWRSIDTTGSWEGEIWNRRKCGELFPEWLTITAVRDEAGSVTHYVATLTDITQRKEAEYEIRNLAFYDPLTRLPNRRLLLERLKHALSAITRSEHGGALLFIDLDNFKTLNDTYGHDMGDLLLQRVAERLAGCVREADTVARLGGDEFVVLLEDLSGTPQDAALQAKTVGEKILEALNRPYPLADHEYHSTPSIGITLFSGPHNLSDDLMKRADLALYDAKAAGRNTLRFFDPAMQAAVTARASLEADLRKGLQQGQFVLHYQPQIDDSGTISGTEALVRWQHPSLGLVPPAAFIPLAEETGLILPLGQWVLTTACRQLAAWAAMPGRAHLSVSVNVSVRQFRQPDFVAQVLAALEDTGALPQRLQLELTESLLLDDVGEVIAKMEALRARGVSFALDDFGTGYSSLSYLRRLPLDQLKIDKSFVTDIIGNTNDAVISRTIVALAHSLGLAVIAEGVETTEQRQFLALQGCRSYQGFLLSAPLALADLEALLDQTAHTA